MVLENHSHEFMCFKLSLLRHTFFLFFLYRSPSSSSCEVLDSISVSIDQALHANPSSQILVCGDFNAHHQEWLTHSRTIDLPGTLSYNFALSYDLEQIVKSPTRFPDRANDSPYLLDLFLCSNPEDCTAEVLAPLGTSDHSVVSVNISCANSTQAAPPVHRTVYQYSKADWDGFRSFLGDIPLDFIFNLNASNAAAELTDWLNIGMDLFIPSKTYQTQSHSQPWFSPACAAAISHRNHYFKLFHRSNTPEHRQLFRTARNKCQRILAEAKDNYAASIRQSILSQRLGSKDFWRIANNVMNRGTSSIPPLFNGPEVLTSSKDKANVLAERFAANSTIQEGEHTLPCFPLRTECVVPKPIITPKNITTIIHSLDSSKATGPDGIPIVVLKHCCPEIAPILSKLFNLCWSESTFPACWKTASVVPIPKKDGVKSDPKTYRPISLLPIISKIFEHLLSKVIISHLEDHNLLSDCQYGFRKQRSTADALALVTARINKILDVGGESRLVALDISKAFDRVWHRGLLHKLKAYGFTGNFLHLISSFLSDRHLQVILDGQISKLHGINAGVPQGSLLGPLLFIIFINDLPDNLLCDVTIYADDTTLSVSYSGAENRTHFANLLNSDLQGVLDWGSSWKITFNPDKTQLLTISRSKNRNFPPIIMASDQLDELSCLRLLGLDITSSLSWRKHIECLAKANSKKIGCLYRARKYLTYTDYKSYRVTSEGDIQK